MAWNTLIHSTTTDAPTVNENFNVISGGDRLPMSSVGVSFTTTDSAYDVGADATRWNELYCDNVNIAGSITTADKSLWGLIGETTLTDTATSIEFTGLDGDVTTTFMIHSNIVSVSDGVYYCYLIINGDSAANYGIQQLRAENATATASRGQGSAINIYSHLTSGSGSARLSIHAKSGHERTILINKSGYSNSTTVYDIESNAYIWNNTADNITSLKIYISPGSAMNTNTNIQLWGRR